ncbi:heterokaryon incompatibility protein-domain-containing protein [Xylaria sp. FL1777]|nr:heterokaryon incompatibility protein-domain-containing protein [Xylaria sp. FL1777]
MAASFNRAGIRHRNINTFIYKQLDLKSSAFRLVRLFKGCPSADIECELIYTTLDENVIPYEAVSYTWGTSVKESSIELNGKKFMVTYNLSHLLKNIRKTKEDRYIWVDAIAINQYDKSERRHQVQRMQAIYRGAESVIFYLGPEAPSTGILMESLNILQRHISGCRWASDDERWKTVWEEIQNKLQLYHGATYFKDIQRRGLEELLERPWFRRVWILQEVANARKALVHSGTTSVHAQIFAMAPTLLEVDLDSHAAAVFALMPTYSGRTPRKPRGGNLGSMLLDFSRSEASDPRDKIFALLGLCEDQQAGKRIIPDYTQTHQDVVCATVNYITHGKLFIPRDSEMCSDITVEQVNVDEIGELIDFDEIPIGKLVDVDEIWYLSHFRHTGTLRRPFETADSVKVNKIERISLLLRHGTTSRPFQNGTPESRLDGCIACVALVRKLETIMEIYIRLHGDIVVWVRQEDLYPVLFFASKPSLGRLIRQQLKGQDVRTEQLLHKLRQTINWNSQYDSLEDYLPSYFFQGSTRKCIIRVLLEHGNTTDRVDKWAQLYMAVLSGETEIVELLLERNPGEFDTPCESANRAFEAATSHDRRHRQPIVRCLLEKGVKIMVVLRNDFEPLCDPLSMALQLVTHLEISIREYYASNAWNYGMTKNSIENSLQRRDHRIDDDHTNHTELQIEIAPPFLTLIFLRGRFVPATVISLDEIL